MKQNPARHPEVVGICSIVVSLHMVEGDWPTASPATVIRCLCPLLRQHQESGNQSPAPGPPPPSGAHRAYFSVSEYLQESQADFCFRELIRHYLRPHDRVDEVREGRYRYAYDVVNRAVGTRRPIDRRRPAPTLTSAERWLPRTLGPVVRITYHGKSAGTTAGGVDWLFHPPPGPHRHRHRDPDSRSRLYPVHRCRGSSEAHGIRENTVCDTEKKQVREFLEGGCLLFDQWQPSVMFWGGGLRAHEGFNEGCPQSTVDAMWRLTSTIRSRREPVGIAEKRWKFLRLLSSDGTDHIASFRPFLDLCCGKVGS